MWPREVHTNKLLHLDLNRITICTDGTPIVLDFGAARQTFNADVPKLTPCTPLASRRGPVPETVPLVPLDRHTESL